MLTKFFRCLHLPKCRWIIAMLIVLSMSAGLYIKTSGKFSPGPLSAAHPKEEPLNGYISHADIDKECGHCHAPLHCVTDNKCQDCHIEIARERATASGLHSRLPGVRRCQTCHIEHQGRQADITELAFGNLNHEKLTGYSLAKHSNDYDGQHLGCESCHAQDRYVQDTLDCLSCHNESDQTFMTEHIETYGESCIDCHDGSDRMHDFDHNNIYLLDGQHAQAECQGCHADKVFGGTTQDCAGCHADPELHANLFGQDCGLCHTAIAWAPARMAQHTFLVDNDVQDLTSCETCHAGSYNGYPCYSCHEQGEMGDTHRQAGVEGGHENCVECHPSGRNGAVVSTDSTSWQPYQKGPTQLAPAANKPKDLPNQEGKDQPLKNKTKQGQPGAGMNSSPWATHHHDPPPAGRESLIPGQHRSQQATVSWTSGK